MDKPPTNYAEYVERTQRNTVISGYGADVRTSYPCPFCGAANWADVPLMDMVAVLSNDHTCDECKRSARFIFNEAPAQTSFELVQTGGDDQPDWFTHKMRRVDNGNDA